MSKKILLLFGTSSDYPSLSSYDIVIRANTPQSILGLNGENMDIRFTQGWWGIPRSNEIMNNLIIYVFAHNARILGGEYVPPYIFKEYKKYKNRYEKENPIQDRWELLDL